MRYILISVLVSFTLSATAQDSLSYSKSEIIYGRKDGLAMTMTMLAPKQKPNGKAIISVISGNWISTDRSRLRLPEWSQIYIDNGYTVFGVMLGSQPRYTIPDEISDLKRAVRFIRYNAKEYSI